MADTLMQYPGGKSGQFKRIQDMMPEHECFVEGFGGSGVITLNKEPSEVDVYNDLDEELVHFFIVFRESTDRLCDWLEDIPYSYSQYEDFIDRFYGEPNKKPPEYGLPGEPITNTLATEDDISYNHVRRAGLFFFLRYSQFGAKYSGRAGFGRSKVQNGAETFANARERLRDFSDSWDHVTIECVTYEKLVDYYDGENTLYYFDPPYVGTEQYYRESDFDHRSFVETLTEIEGYWIVSYDELPKVFDEEIGGRDNYYVTVEESTNFIDSGVKGEGKDTIETMVTNFDPDEVNQHSPSQQSGLQDIQETSTNGSEETQNTTEGIKLFGDEEDDNTSADGWLSNEN